MAYHLKSFGSSDIGLVRKNNEDVWAEMPKHRFFVLADGMGGHPAGEVAAEKATSFLCKKVDRLFTPPYKPSDLASASSRLSEAIISANLEVFELAQTSCKLAGMGTTLCCCMLYGKDLIYAHVGDSRLYLFRNDLLCLTEDHSLDRFQNHDNPTARTGKNILTRSIGTCPDVLPEVGTLFVHPGDILFLCSDGLTDLLSEKEIFDIIEQSVDITTAVQNLIHMAKIQGGTDNITILMIEVIDE